MKPLGLSINALARQIDVPPNRISEIVGGKRAVTADTALRLGKYFGVSPEMWLGLQADYDLRLAKRGSFLYSVLLFLRVLCVLGGLRLSSRR